MEIDQEALLRLLLAYRPEGTTLIIDHTAWPRLSARTVGERTFEHAPRSKATLQWYKLRRLSLRDCFHRCNDVNSIECERRKEKGFYARMMVLFCGNINRGGPDV